VATASAEETRVFQS